MSTIEIKNKLISVIKNTNNKNLLEELYQLLSLDRNTIKPYELNSEQVKSISVAREQIKNNDYLSNEDANNEIDEWLNK
ncbi:MAG: hypothetical protein ABF242_05400 [Flavobacteriales bacterium]